MAGLVCKPTLGFAAAIDIKPGDHVNIGNTPRQVLEVRNAGRDAPYFRVFGCFQEWYSWQNCGSVERE